MVQEHTTQLRVTEWSRYVFRICHHLIVMRMCLVCCTCAANRVLRPHMTGYLGGAVAANLRLP